jgi:hypothetical protein
MVKHLLGMQELHLLELNRATLMSGAPTKTILTQVSDRDRHLFHFGTETTIGDITTQDPMFIRFSNQEDYNTYQPTATNTAGTFRLIKVMKLLEQYLVKIIH